LKAIIINSNEIYIDTHKNLCYTNTVTVAVTIQRQQSYRHDKIICGGGFLEDRGHSFNAYFKRATSPLVVLAILRQRPMYGYEISAEMKRRSNGKFGIAVLYPILYRLEEQGFVEVSGTEVIDGRARSYYRITEKGEAHLTQSLDEFKVLAAIFIEITEGEKA
jgi:PadR family transcriptional regulator PadR